MSNYFSRLLISTDLNFGPIGSTVKLDGRIRETFNISLEATDHPVDFNTNITDHLIIKPRNYVLEGIVTDTPLGLISSPLAIGGNVLRLIGGGQGLAGSLFNFNENVNKNMKPSVRAFRKLVSIAEARQPFKITTALGHWSDMAIISLDVEIDKNTANTLYFTAVCREIRRVKITLKTNNIGIPSTIVKPRTEGIVKKGRQAAQQSKSIFASVVDFFKE